MSEEQLTRGTVGSDLFLLVELDELETIYEHYVDGRSYIIQIIQKKSSNEKYNFRFVVMHKRRIIYARSADRTTSDSKDFVDKVLRGFVYLMFSKIEHLTGSKGNTHTHKIPFEIEDKKFVCEITQQKINPNEPYMLQKVDITITVKCYGLQIYQINKVTTFCDDFIFNVIPTLQFLIDI
ncbi:MAG: hypothetical protein Hyperionvirus2_73 [Hyperionvirus sp.]|uniref:Uncharacterized protein n=1 Tax=Hyperionvirus sp. TaxID=2487770 RepID=A0A3G5A632_9VIRU|nr:MAG: hypothetical protein Hyperionvirus2_73 [Hyperionvirus sp.]